MKILLLLMTCFLIGCSSSDSGSSYKKVSVSSSEATALSALSNLNGNQKSESSALSTGSSESPLKAAILKK